MRLLITTQSVDINHPILGFFHGWILEFAKKFDQVYVICLEEGEHSLPDNVHIYSLGKEDGESRIKYTWRFYKYYTKLFFKADYIFYHMGAIYNVMAAPFYLLGKLQGRKFYWWKTHGQINWLGKLALLFVDRVYTAIEESFPVKTKKRHVVGHAIDIDLFEFSTTNKVPNSILFVGRFARSKRLEQVLEIVKKLQEKGIVVQAKFIGQVVDEKYYSEVKAIAHKLDVESQVEFIAGMKQSELVKEYQQAKVFINPSDNDGLDKVVLEAMLSGTVPLTANASFARVLGDYDLFLAKGDIDGYTTATLRVLDMSDTDYNNLAKELRDYVIQNHALSTLMDRIF